MRKILMAATVLFIPGIANAQQPTTPQGTYTQFPARSTTFSTGFTAVTVASTPTDIVTLTGSASKTVFVRRMACNGVSTAAGVSPVAIVLRSTANTAGTTVTPSATNGGQIVAMDSNNAAATATVAAYTANPTTGTLTGVVRADRITSGTAGGGGSTRTVWDFGSNYDQGPTLRGANQVFALSGLGQAVAAGLVVSCDLEWIEQ